MVMGIYLKQNYTKGRYCVKINYQVKIKIIMPFGNGQGPMGQGPMTGRGLGYCAGYTRPGYMNSASGRGYFGWGRGFGRGRGWYNWGWPGYGPAYPPAQPTVKEEKEMIKEEREMIQGEMDALKEQTKALEDRLEELKKKKK